MPPDTLEMLTETRRTRTVGDARRTGRRPLALALAAASAFLGVSSHSEAQTTLAERLRLQGGFLTEARPSPAPRIEDVWVSAIPQISLTLNRPKAMFRVTYQLTGALHSLAGLSELANWLALAGAFDLSSRTRLLVSAEAIQTTLSNYFITRPAEASPVALFPGTTSRFLNARVSQGLQHELSARTRVEQTFDVNVFTTLAPTPPLDALTATASGSIERDWSPRDAVGIETRVGYAGVHATPPTPDQQYGTFTMGPRWRHDWSDSFSSLVAAGATAIVPLDRAESPLLAPSGRASLLYTSGASTVEALYTGGILPSVLTGQLARTHLGVLRAATPISEHHQINLTASIGYLWADLVDTRNTGNDLRYDAFLSHAELTWQTSPHVQVFGRYQFLAQLGDVNARGVNPSYIRDFFLVGVQLSSEPIGEQQPVPTSFPQRVDRSDDRRRRPEEERSEAERERSEEPGAPRPGGPQAPGGVVEPPRQQAPNPPRGPARWIHTTPATPPTYERPR